MHTDKETRKCQEPTWKGTACTRKAKYVFQTYSGKDGQEVCGQHLGSAGPGMRYRDLDEQ